VAEQGEKRGGPDVTDFHLHECHVLAGKKLRRADSVAGQKGDCLLPHRNRRVRTILAERGKKYGEKNATLSNGAVLADSRYEPTLGENLRKRGGCRLYTLKGGGGGRSSRKKKEKKLLLSRKRWIRGPSKERAYYPYGESNEAHSSGKRKTSFPCCPET